MYTDHKSLESWYQEDLCTLSGPLAKRGRWHGFLRGYHIEVVYRPGRDNTVAGGHVQPDRRMTPIITAVMPIKRGS